MHFKKSFGIKMIRRRIKSKVKDKREDKQTRKEEEGGEWLHMFHFFDNGQFSVGARQLRRCMMSISY